MQYQTITKHSKLIKIMLYKIIKGLLWQEHGSKLLALDFHSSWTKHTHKEESFKTINWNEAYYIHNVVNEVIESGVLSEESTKQAQSYLDALKKHLDESL